MQMQISVHKDFQKLLDLLLAQERILLTTHIRPDPDGWGAQIGLYYLMQSKKKDVLIFNQDPYAGKTFNNGSFEAIVYNDGHDFDRSILENRTVVSLDNSSIERLGKAASYIKEDHSNLIVIDHHDGIPSNGKTFFMFPHASATSEIVYVLLALAEQEPPLHVAQALYTGLVFDNGFFRYGKTTSLSHRVAARLLNANVKPAEISEMLHAGYRFSRLKVRQILYNNLQSTEDKRIAWFAVHVDTLKAEGASLDDLGGLVDDLFEAAEVQIGILFSQRGPNFTRVAFRSRYAINVLPLAEKFGGGGHKTACGVKLDLELDEAIREIIPLAKKCLP